MDLLQEPSQPRGHVQTAALGMLEDVVVSLPFPQKLGREAEQAHGLAFVPAEHHVGNSTCQATVAILERMQGDEPEVSNPGPDQAVYRSRGMIDPLQVAGKLRVQSGTRRCDEIHLLPADGPGDYLHRLFAAQLSHPNGLQPGIAGGEQGCLPAEQPLGSHGKIMVFRGVQQDLDQAVHGALRYRDAREPQVTGYRGAHGGRVEPFTFDSAGGQAVFRQNRGYRLLG